MTSKRTDDQIGQWAGQQTELETDQRTGQQPGQPTDQPAGLRPSRRDLLRLGLLAGPASLLAACGWGGGPLAPALGGVSRFNDWVGERLLSTGRPGREYAVSERTPERLFPAYSQVRPFPLLEDPVAWGLEVGGLVEKPQRLTLAMLQALPRVTYTVKHHCVE